MDIVEHNLKHLKVAELQSENLLLNNLDDALQLMGDMYYNGYDAIIMNASLVTPDFFDLKTKLAGEILQKFSNYRMRLAILGDWSDNSSKSLSDFIRESNNGKLIYFGKSITDTIAHWGQ